MSQIYETTDGEWVVRGSSGVKHRFATAQEAQKMARENDFITEARAATRAIWEGINTLKALQREYNALDYGNTLDVGVDENAGITAAHVGAVVFDTANALEAVLSQGHATNLARLL